MELTLRARNQRSMQKVEQDFHWYDTVHKKMLTGRGGEMRFRYVPSQRRMVPYIVDHESEIYENNFDRILEWVHHNTPEFNITVVDSARRNFVLIHVSALQFDDITESLYRSRIVFDYDEKQLHREQAEEKQRQRRLKHD